MEYTRLRMYARSVSPPHVCSPTRLKSICDVASDRLFTLIAGLAWNLHALASNHKSRQFKNRLFLTLILISLEEINIFQIIRAFFIYIVYSFLDRGLRKYYGYTSKEALKFNSESCRIWRILSRIWRTQKYWILFDIKYLWVLQTFFSKCEWI